MQECPVCYQLHDENLQYQCSHSICSDCFDRWRQRNYTCPTCRAVQQSVQQPIHIESNLIRYYSTITNNYNYNSYNNNSLLRPSDITQFNRVQRDNELLQYINNLANEGISSSQLDQEINIFRNNLVMGL